MSTEGLFGPAAFEPALAKMLRPPRPASSTADRVPQAELLAIIEAGKWSLLQEDLDAVRAQHAARIEEEILEAIPEVCAFVRSEIDEMARRREKTRATYRRRFGAFRKWAENVGWKLPFPPAAVCLYFIERANAGAPISEIQADRIAIAAVHEELGHASPCRRDPLVKAIIRYIGSKPGEPDGGEPMPAPEAEQQKAAA